MLPAVHLPCFEQSGCVAAKVTWQFQAVLDRRAWHSYIFAQRAASLFCSTPTHLISARRELSTCLGSTQAAHCTRVDFHLLLEATSDKVAFQELRGPPSKHPVSKHGQCIQLESRTASPGTAGALFRYSSCCIRRWQHSCVPFHLYQQDHSSSSGFGG